MRGAKDACFGKGRLALAVQECRIDFNMALSDKRRYPIAQFRAFLGNWETLRRDDEARRSIYRVVIESVYCLTDYLMVERKRVPELVIRDAQRAGEHDFRRLPFLFRRA
jgi:hypothetical protein